MNKVVQGAKDREADKNKYKETKGQTPIILFNIPVHLASNCRNATTVR